MDTDCGMPWDMASLGDVRERVQTLEQEVSDVNTYATDLGDSAVTGTYVAAIEERVNTLERSCVVSVHEGRLPLNMGVDVAKPAICSPLTKMGLTAVTDAQFREMAVYVSDVLYSKQTFRAHYVGQSESEVIADALQAYAKGAR
jgi:hypothetical protein